MKYKVLIILLVISYHCLSNFSKLCDSNKTSFYFEPNSYELKGSDKIKLDSLASILKDNFYIELHGFADTTYNANYNLKLSKLRAESIKEYLKFENVLIMPHGESNPKFSGLFYDDLAKNRRVDLIYIPTYNNRIRVVGERKSIIEMPVNGFRDKSICDCYYDIEEIKTDQEALNNGIPMISVNDEILTTGGMVRFNSDDCLSNNCTDSVKLTLPWGNIDTEMSSWVLIETEDGMRWDNLNSPLKFDTVNGTYTMMISCDIWLKGLWFNVDKILEPFTTLTSPLLARWIDSVKIRPKVEVIKIDDTLSRINFLQLKDSSMFYDIGINENCDIYYIEDTLAQYTKDGKNYRIPLSSYTQLEHSDTILILKSKEPIIFFTHLKNYNAIINNDIYITESNFFEKLFGFKTKYVIPLPIAEYFLTIDNKELQELNVKIKYKRRRVLYKYKLKNTK